MEVLIHKNEFIEIYDDLGKYILSEKTLEEISIFSLAQIIFSNDNEINLKEILKSAFKLEEGKSRSILLRIFLILLVDKANVDSINIFDHYNTDLVWELIAVTIHDLHEQPLQASVGSQGFLSIPLYRTESNRSTSILRVHIWDSFFEHKLNKSTLNNFSIHSHRFYAQSWIIHGNLKDSQYDEGKSTDENWNYFEIKWEKSKLNKEDMDRKSILVNTGRRAKIRCMRTNDYQSGDTYEIPAGMFHRSEATTTPTVTLFYFNSLKSSSNSSSVIGPSDQSEAPEYDYSKMEISELLHELSKLISPNGTG